MPEILFAEVDYIFESFSEVLVAYMSAGIWAVCLAGVLVGVFKALISVIGR